MPSKKDVFDDEEIDRLEELRRHGNPDNQDDDDDEDIYYTLPLPRENVMEDWLEWRTRVNEIMSSVISESRSGVDYQTDWEMLTTPATEKTPEFFKHERSIQGQRVKDEYGSPVIQENDDAETKQRKKIMDENFYLFGIPRISLRRCSLQADDLPGSTLDSRSVKSMERVKSAESEKDAPNESFRNRLNTCPPSMAASGQKAKSFGRRISLSAIAARARLLAKNKTGEHSDLLKTKSSDKIHLSVPRNQDTDRRLSVPSVHPERSAFRRHSQLPILPPRNVESAERVSSAYCEKDASNQYFRKRLNTCPPSMAASRKTHLIVGHCH